MSAILKVNEDVLRSIFAFAIHGTHTDERNNELEPRRCFDLLHELRAGSVGHLDGVSYDNTAMSISRVCRAWRALLLSDIDDYRYRHVHFPQRVGDQEWQEWGTRIKEIWSIRSYQVYQISFHAPDFTILRQFIALDIVSHNKTATKLKISNLVDDGGVEHVKFDVESHIFRALYPSILQGPNALQSIFLCLDLAGQRAAAALVRGLGQLTMLESVALLLRIGNDEEFTDDDIALPEAEHRMVHLKDLCLEIKGRNRCSVLDKLIGRNWVTPLLASVTVIGMQAILRSIIPPFFIREGIATPELVIQTALWIPTEGKVSICAPYPAIRELYTTTWAIKSAFVEGLPSNGTIHLIDDFYAADHNTSDPDFIVFLLCLNMAIKTINSWYGLQLQTLYHPSDALPFRNVLFLIDFLHSVLGHESSFETTIRLTKHSWSDFDIHGWPGGDLVWYTVCMFRAVVKCTGQAQGLVKRIEIIDKLGNRLPNLKMPNVV